MQWMPKFLLFFFCLNTWSLLEAQKQIKEKSLVTGKEVTVNATGDIRKVNHNKAKKYKYRKEYLEVYVYNPEAAARKQSKKYYKGTPNPKDLELKKKNLHNLIGNPCVQQVTQDFGFQYVLVTHHMDMKKSEIFFHNFWTGFKMCFKKGPFWKKRLRKRIRDCQQNTSDIVG